VFLGGLSAAKRAEISTYAWVSPVIVGLPSDITEDNVESLKSRLVIFSRPKIAQHYEVLAPVAGERVCHRWTEGESFIFMYEYLFTKISVQLLFSDFEIEVLKHLQVSSSQLHCNGWGFVKVFEKVCRFYGCDPSLKVFFYLFEVYHKKESGGESFVSTRCILDRIVFTPYT